MQHSELLQQGEASRSHMIECLLKGAFPTCTAAHNFLVLCQGLCQVLLMQSLPRGTYIESCGICQCCYYELMCWHFCLFLKTVTLENRCTQQDAHLEDILMLSEALIAKKIINDSDIMALGNLIQLWCPCSLQGSWTRWPSEVSSNSQDSMII